MVHFSYTFLSVLDSYITVIKEFLHFHLYFGSIARYKIQEGKAHIFRTTEEVEKESSENCENPEVVRTQWEHDWKEKFCLWICLLWEAGVLLLLFLPNTHIQAPLPVSQRDSTAG